MITLNPQQSAELISIGIENGQKFHYDPARTTLEVKTQKNETLLFIPLDREFGGQRMKGYFGVAIGTEVGGVKRAWMASLTGDISKIETKIRAMHKEYVAEIKRRDKETTELAPKVFSDFIETHVTKQETTIS